LYLDTPFLTKINNRRTDADISEKMPFPGGRRTMRNASREKCDICNATGMEKVYVIRDGVSYIVGEQVCFLCKGSAEVCSKCGMPWHQEGDRCDIDEEEQCQSM
jgi:hypothetical protein